MQYATPPDVDRLIIGGRQRRRHRNLVRAGGAALALVLVGGGAYAVMHQDGGTAQGSRLADAPSATSDPTGDPQAAVELPPDAGPRAHSTRARTASSSGATPVVSSSRRT